MREYYLGIIAMAFGVALATDHEYGLGAFIFTVGLLFVIATRWLKEETE